MLLPAEDQLTRWPTAHLQSSSNNNHKKSHLGRQTRTVSFNEILNIIDTKVLKRHNRQFER